MARSYFFDAWFFIALVDPRDTHHRNARRLTTYVIGADLVTHDSVLTEVLTYFAEEGAHARATAARTIRAALQSLRVASIDRDLFLAALDLYERRPDKEYSLVDCLSMVLMRRERITHILTNDHHFRQEGFTVVSDVS